MISSRTTREGLQWIEKTVKLQFGTQIRQPFSGHQVQVVPALPPHQCRIASASWHRPASGIRLRVVASHHMRRRHKRLIHLNVQTEIIADKQYFYRFVDDFRPDAVSG